MQSPTLGLFIHVQRASRFQGFQDFQGFQGFQQFLGFLGILGVLEPLELLEPLESLELLESQTPRTRRTPRMPRICWLVGQDWDFCHFVLNLDRVHNIRIPQDFYYMIINKPLIQSDHSCLMAYELQGQNSYGVTCQTSPKWAMFDRRLNHSSTPLKT